MSDDLVRAIRNVSKVAKSTCGIALFTLLVLCGMVYVTWRHDKSLDKLAILASANYQKIVQFRATQDAQDLIVVHYIQDTITAINKLQRDNSDPRELQARGLKVPKAPELRLPNAPAPTAHDLERPTWKSAPPPPAPEPTPPLIADHHKKKAKQAHPPVTPRPWYKFFKSSP